MAARGANTRDYSTRPVLALNYFSGGSAMETPANVLKSRALGDQEVFNAETAVAWPAIIAGAFTAAAVSLILLLLGSALGLASVSPWAHSGVSAVTFSVTAAIWLIIMQWVASGLGGYLTGRLRSKWLGMHTDEVFFRDTAHGFLAWALATVLTAAFLASAASSIVGGGVRAATNITAGALAGAGQAAGQNPEGMKGEPLAYFVDSLYRTNNMAPNASEKDVRGETTRILVTGVKNGIIPDADKAYLAQLIAAHTGLSQADATARVNDTITQIDAAETKLGQEADKARKTASTISLLTFLSLLVGAFIATTAAALGGKHRDEF